MILNRENINIKTIGDIKFNSVEIAENSGAKIISMLTHNLYSNPLKSFIRETVSNAVDSTKEAGNDNPVVVSLSTINDDTRITVRDFGTGLSPERFDQVFRFLGGSTKENSNDYIGCFGIGRFSCLAVANEAEITSFYDGVCYKYLMYKTSNGINIDLLHTQPTDEPNGLQVSVIIAKEPDTHIDDVEKTLDYFENVVIIKDDEVVERIKINKVGSIVLRSRSNKYDHGQLIMNGVHYDIDLNAIRNILGFNKVLLISETCVGSVINVNIGDVNVTPNREALLYDEYTCNNIYKRAKEIKKEFIALKEKEIGEKGITRDNWQIISHLKWLACNGFGYNYPIIFNGETFFTEHIQYFYDTLMNCDFKGIHNTLLRNNGESLTGRYIRIVDIVEAFKNGNLYLKPSKLNKHSRDYIINNCPSGTILVTNNDVIKIMFSMIDKCKEDMEMQVLKEWLSETIIASELSIPKEEPKAKDKKEKDLDRVRYKIMNQIFYKELSELEKDKDQYAIIPPDADARHSHIGKRYVIKVNKTMYAKLLELGFKSVASLVKEAIDDLFYKRLYSGLEETLSSLKEIGYTMDKKIYNEINEGNSKYLSNYNYWIKTSIEVPKEYKWIENLKELIGVPLYGQFRLKILKQLLPINFEINDKNEITGQKPESSLFV